MDESNRVNPVRIDYDGPVKLYTIECIPGAAPMKALGVVSGSTVQAVHFGKDFIASLQHMAGGEITDYADMLARARAVATRRMAEQAEALGAHAVVGIRYATSEVMEGASEVLAYGTALRLQ